MARAIEFAEDTESAKDRAIKLLKHVVTEKEWERFKKISHLEVIGKSGDMYWINPYGQTIIRRKKWSGGYELRYACVVLDVLAPTWDRMIAEYVMIKNDEEMYLRTANVMKGIVLATPHPFVITAMFMLDLFLVMNLATMLWDGL